MRTACLLFALAAGCATAQPPATEPAQPLDWRTLEAPYLRHHVQLTFPDRFARAGEAYFSPDGAWIVFQAIERPREGEEAMPFYAMFVARLERDGDGRVTGLSHVERISPEGSANTCGWFHPTQPWRVMFGSTLVRPADEQRSGFQVQSRTYRWMFPDEMEVVERAVGTIRAEATARGGGGLALGGDAFAGARPVFVRPRYDAECSCDPTGRFILYSHVEEQQQMGRADANIYIYDTRTARHHAIVVAPGYDGGPFFSPDARSICYRSDRKGDDLLQLFVADLKFEKGEDGVDVPVGIEREYQLTDNGFVNWCPFWHPGGGFQLYATNEVTPRTHANYEVFAVESDMGRLRGGEAAGEARRLRVTHADGADVLPAFSTDGTLMMWCSQRGGVAEGSKDGRPSSQLWIAAWVGGNPFPRAHGAHN